MVQDAADVVAGHVRQTRVARLVVEQRLAVLPQRLVGVHAGTVVTEQRLGHEGDGLAVLPRGVLDDVLEQQHIVGRGQQRVELVVDLGLSGGADLVVAALQDEARVLQVGGHLVAQVHIVVIRSDGEVAALGPHLVAAVGGAVGLIGLAAVPPARLGVDLVEGAVDLRVEAHRIEDVELGLGTEVAGVGDAGAGEVVLRLAGDVARIARVRLTGEGIVHEEAQVQRLGRPERIDACRVGIRQQHHVRLVDRLEAAHRGAVEGQPVLEHALVECRCRDREVLDDTGQIAEPNVDVLDVLVLDQLEDVIGGLFCHYKFSFSGDPRVDAMDTMLHGHQPYVASKLRNAS